MKNMTKSSRTQMELGFDRAEIDGLRRIQDFKRVLGKFGIVRGEINFVRRKGVSGEGKNQKRKRGSENGNFEGAVH